MHTATSQQAIPASWEIAWRVRSVAAETCGKPFETVNLDSRLIEDLDIDSLALVELIMNLEDEFGVTLPDEELSRVFTNSPVTLGSLATLIRQRWGTGTPVQGNRRRDRPAISVAEEAPFTQLGPEPETMQPGLIHEPLGINREGYAEHRRRSDGMRCILIPGGVASLGSHEPNALADQRPVHAVHMSEFLMDAEPVSNSTFALFLNSIGNLPPNIIAEWCGVRDGDQRQAQFALIQKQRRWLPIPGTERLPMILVSWFGANAYSLWANGFDWRFYRADGAIPAELDEFRSNLAMAPGELGFSLLPSEAQWEYAARGSTAVGESTELTLTDRTTAQVAQHIAGTNYQADTIPASPVNMRLGMSPFGLHHMGGNVWQWCRDWYAPDFYVRPEATQLDSQNTVATGIRSERGGSWVGPAELAAPWYRRGRPAEARGRCLGFRCIGLFSEPTTR